jgi:hypothetical protein
MIRPYNPGEKNRAAGKWPMDAAVVRKLGKPPRREQFPEPGATDNEVIVHVHAASLKPVV